MDLDPIDVGVLPNDGKGDPVRVVGIKTNANFAAVAVRLGDLGTAVKAVQDAAVTPAFESGSSTAGAPGTAPVLTLRPGSALGSYTLDAVIPVGERGAPGIGINPKGTFATLAALPSVAQPGDTYIAGANDTATPSKFVAGDGLVWIGTGGDLGPGGNYHNVGAVRGPPGSTTVDGLTDAGTTGRQLAKASTPAAAKTTLAYRSSEILHIPSGATSQEAVQTVLARTVQIETYANGDDLAVDCGPALIRAAAAAGIGGSVLCRGGYRLATPVPSLTQVRIVGQVGRVNAPLANENIYARASRFTVALSAFAPDGSGVPTAPALPSLGRGVSVNDLTFVLEGLGLPYASPAAARTGLARYKGTVLGTINPDFTAENCLFVGFNRVSDGYLAGNGRVDFLRCYADCNNGFRIYGSLDNNRPYANHAWPFTTVAVPGMAGDGSDNDILLRLGIAHEWFGRADGTVSLNDLGFGYQVNFKATDCPGIRIALGWADHGNPLSNGQVGVWLVGDCGAAEILSTVSVACRDTLIVDTGFNAGTFGNGTGPTDTGRPVRVIGGTWNGETNGIHHVSGDLVVIGAGLEAGQQIKVEAGIRSLVLLGNTFTRGGGILVPDTATERKIIALGNRYISTPRYRNEGYLDGNVGGQGGLFLANYNGANADNAEFGLVANIDGTISLVGYFSDRTGIVEMIQFRRNGAAVLSPVFPAGLPNYASDAAAGSGNVPVGGLYRNGSVVQIRVS